MSGTATLPRVVVLNDVDPGYYAEYPTTLNALAGLAEVEIRTQETSSAAQPADWLRGAWATNEVRRSRAQLAVDNVVAALSGRPRNVLNPAALEHAAWGQRPLQALGSA